MVRMKIIASSVGMSTPVDSKSTVTTIPGSTGRFLNSLILCNGLSTFPVIFLTNSPPLSENSSLNHSTRLSACDVCGTSVVAKTSVFGNLPYFSSKSLAYLANSFTIFLLVSGAVAFLSIELAVKSL